MFAHPGHQPAQASATLTRGSRIGYLRPSWLRVLLLAAVPLHVHEKSAGDGDSGFLSKVFADQEQRQIDSRGGTSGAIEFSVFEHDGGFLDLEFSKSNSYIQGILPMGSDPMTIQQPCGRQTINAGANRGNPPGLRSVEVYPI